MKTSVVRALGLFASVVVAGVASAQSAQPSAGYLRLSRATDTIALNKSVPLGTSYTIETRIRYWGLPDSTSDVGRLFSEQQDSVADKCVIFRSAQTGLLMDIQQMVQGSNHYGLAVSPLADTNWHHLAIVRSPDRLRVFIDGQETESVAAFGFGTSGVDVSLGAFKYRIGPLFQSIKADIDWFRISSSARYETGNFVPPTECKLVSDASTLALFKFNAPLQAAVPVEGTLALTGAPGQGFSGATTPEVVLESTEAEITVSGVQPISGPSAGGTVISIIGTGFTPDATVFIGGLPAINVTYVSPTRITAVTPEGLPGIASVQVNCASSEAFYYRPECGSDLDQNGVVDGGDMSILLLDWGQCYATVASPQADDATPFMLQEQTAASTSRSR